MIEIISGSLYRSIAGKITQPIDADRLPLYSEKEIRKTSAELYGKVKIKLDLETDDEKIKLVKSYHENEAAYKLTYFTYTWEADENKLPAAYEKYIKPEIEKFIQVLSIFNTNNEQVLRFSVVDGDYRETERPGHRLAVQYALMGLFEQI